MTTELQLPKCWSEVKDVLEAGLERLILNGPPGTGKSFAGLNYGLIPGRTAYRLTCNQEMTDAELRGHWMPTAGGTWEWHDGALIQAWRDGTRVVIDEVDQASGDVLAIMLAGTDSNASCQWRSPATGEVVRPRDGFSVVMTTNVEDMRDLPTALVDRFPVVIRINAPHPDALTFLSEDLRIPASLSADADGHRRISLRGWQAFDQLRKGLVIKYGQEEGQQRAAEVVFRDRAEAILDSLRIANA